MNDKLRNLQAMLNETIYKEPKFTEKQKRQILSHIKNNNVKVKHRPFVPTAVFSLFLVVFSLVLFQLYNKNEFAFKADSISDPLTSPTIEHVVATEKDFLIDWLSDSMDRGNHDYITTAHSKLVVTSTTDNLKRGDVIYFEKSSKNYIARVVALPGEQIEIKNGQVFINEKKLDVFYGVATVRGLNEKQFFDAINSTNSTNINLESKKEYFSTDMALAAVQENTYFVLVDQWWRGVDSRTLGPIHIDEIKGVVLGYQE